MNGKLDDLMTDVSRETLADLDQFETLVGRWTEKINLVSTGDKDHIRERHIHDCIQISQLISKSPPDKLLDLGSGGGFPAIVIAIFLKNAGEQSEVTCIEADARKATFLRVAALELGLKISVVVDRIENFRSGTYPVVTARALAPLTELFELTKEIVDAHTKLLFMKGSNWRSEVETAREQWEFHCVDHPSMTNPNAALLELSHVIKR